MSKTLTIAWRDFKSIAFSPIFFLISGMCAVIWSYTYLRSLNEFAVRSMIASNPQLGGGQVMNIHYSVFVNHMSLVNIILVFAIPVLTMRLIAEEKKMRTYDLLLTAPVTATNIALGKFLAGFGAVCCLLLVSLFYPLGTAVVADFNIGQLLLTYFGLALLSGAYVSVGLFASSLTSSIMLSVTMGVIFNVILLLLSQGAGLSDNETYRAIVEHISVGDHLFNFFRGTFSISSMIFFFTLISLFVFLSQRVIESSRWR